MAPLTHPTHRSRSRAAAAHAAVAVAPSRTVHRAAASRNIAGVVPRDGLFEQLSRAARVTTVSAPAGSGKTVLLRSWTQEAGVGESAAWVSVDDGQHDPQRFWIAVLDALGGTRAGTEVVRGLTPAPALDGWAIVERLLGDLESLDRRIWLVIDDLHELRSTEALRQLEVLLMRAPAALRFVLSSRHDLRLGLHRLRLEDGLTEIRAEDLRFSRDDSRRLLEAGGLKLSDSALALLYERTEGWAAGLRLAAMSLIGHPDPERFAEEFSGSERTVAEYLLAEVLERQPLEVRRLLLRTSLLERVSGPLADVLTGASGSERILHELERAGAFVVPVDASKCWFRYHHLFADLLALELRRSEPGEVAALHRTAAEWFAEHEHPVEAIRHAQAGEDWCLAAGLLSQHWLCLELSGRAATAHELLAAFPEPVVAADAELTALLAADELNRGSFEQAQHHLAMATSEVPLVRAESRGRFQVTVGTLRLTLACRRADLSTVVEQAQRLLAPVASDDVALLGLSEDRRALALIELGIAEADARRDTEAELHLEQGTALARRTARPYLELLGLAHGARIAIGRSYALGAQRSRQAVELAARHGWSEEPLTGVAYAQLAAATVAQGHLGEAERWLERATRTLRAELQPAAGMALHWTRGELELARDRPERALEAFRAAERLAELLLSASADAAPIRAQRLHALARLGQTGAVEAALAELDEEERDTVLVRSVTAALRLAGGDPQAATVALAPATGGSAAAVHPIWRIEALLLEAVARDALGEAADAHRALERALDLAEPDGVLLPFLLHRTPAMLERHRRSRTSHAALVSELLNLLAGGPSAPAAGEGEPSEALSASELRILRYLPTNLSLREIGNELCVSVATVKTHAQHLYRKLGVHSRNEAVEHARGLGLLAPSSRAG